MERQESKRAKMEPKTLLDFLHSSCSDYEFEEDEVAALHRGGFNTRAALAGVTREDLALVKGLRPATVKMLVSAFSAAAQAAQVAQAAAAQAAAQTAAAQAAQVAQAAAAQAAAQTDVDNSANFGKNLLQPSLEASPALDDLASFLAKAPSARIPITSEALSFARRSGLSRELQQCFTAASGRLARAVASSLTSPLVFGPSEMWTVCTENTVVIALLLELDAVLPAFVRLGVVAERDQQDSTSLMTVKSQGGTSLRPDGMLRDSAGLRMLAMWEDKAESLPAAVEDLHKKTAMWTPLYYGNIEYLPCFAAAGRVLEFYAIARQGLRPRSVSAVLQLDNVNDRAQAVVTTIKFYQLLRAQRARYPDNVLSAGSESRAVHPCGFTRALLFRTDKLAVRKRLSPWSKFAAYSGVDFGRLKDLYSTTAQQQGVVHAVQGGPTLQDDRYSVDLVPVGLQYYNVLPLKEDDVRHMVHGLLHGLATIHEAGFVHRDLRWDNIACCSAGHRWFLLDLETCAPVDELPVASFEPAGWYHGVTLVDGRYTRASDLFQLGLVVEKCRHLVASAAGTAFLGAILTHPKDQKLSAAQLLSHAWLRCEGVNCRAAGAQPGDG